MAIVLGAPLDTSVGARGWAGHPPNLLNVAVTRAKHRLYVIGSRDAWKTFGEFSICSGAILTGLIRGIVNFRNLFN